jgi:hypothetical protein
MDKEGLLKDYNMQEKQFAMSHVALHSNANA